jgi:hypothetical protein
MIQKDSDYALPVGSIFPVCASHVNRLHLQHNITIELRISVLGNSVQRVMIHLSVDCFRQLVFMSVAWHILIINVSWHLIKSDSICKMCHLYVNAPTNIYH